jgi:hypothetical protein
MDQAGHRSVQMVRRHIGGATLFCGNSSGKLGLSEEVVVRKNPVVALVTISI